MIFCKCGNLGRIDKRGTQYKECKLCLQARVSKSNKGNIAWNKNVPRSEETKKKISLANKGKIFTAEQKKNVSKACSGKKNGMYGKKHSKVSKQLMSKNSKGQECWMKGKKMSDEHKHNLSKACMGRVCSEETKEIHRQNALNMSDITKKKISDKLKGENHPLFNKQHNTETKKKMRISAIRRIEKQTNDGLPVKPNIGRNETKILNNIEQNKNIKLERQHPICGYFVDGYDKENNIVYEVDEKYHLRQEEKDKQRQQEIINELGCKFIRVEDY